MIGLLASAIPDGDPLATGAAFAGLALVGWLWLRHLEHRADRTRDVAEQRLRAGR